MATNLPFHHVARVERHGPICRISLGGHDIGVIERKPNGCTVTRGAWQYHSNARDAFGRCMDHLIHRVTGDPSPTTIYNTD
jgi:hypothetical protein